MSKLLKITGYELKNLTRSKWTILFTVFYFVICESLFLLEDKGEKVILSLFNFILLFIPVISLFFGITFINNEKPFIELLLSQPVRRRDIFNGLYFSLSLSLTATMLIGVGLPVVLHYHSYKVAIELLLIFFGTSVLLNQVFIGVAFLAAFVFSDRSKGLLFVIGFWLFTFIIYDIAILIISYVLKDYPVDNLILFITIINPVDVGRILLLLQFDIAALMGYTAAIYQMSLGSFLSSLVLKFILLLWAYLPYFISKLIFRKRDFIL
ncbi:MAG: ABC transporter permease subunit [Ignavibacteriaceae bacterium]|nr:ABC transporter permease subunit [Ignavibacteriaceae bacterium]